MLIIKSEISHFFEQPHGLESILEFLATETWLYDSRPVIGEIYREFVRDCYQQNLFIKNEMRIDGNIVDQFVRDCYQQNLFIKNEMISTNNHKSSYRRFIYT